MAPLALTGLVLGLTALSAATPINPRQEADPTTTVAGLESSIATPIVDGDVLPSGKTDIKKWVRIARYFLILRCIR